MNYNIENNKERNINKETIEEEKKKNNYIKRKTQRNNKIK